MSDELEQPPEEEQEHKVLAEQSGAEGEKPAVAESNQVMTQEAMCSP